MNLAANSKHNEVIIEPENLYGDSKEPLITEPFNPNDIDVDIETVNLGYMLRLLEDDIIDLQPDFQRASDVWDNTKKSRLIESVLLGLPLPSFYFSEDKVTKKRLVIDGLQRLCAFKDFLFEKENPLKLENLQFLKPFEGKTYSDLASPERRRIDSLKITMNTLRRDTPKEVKFIIFQLVNTAGIPLTPQEMRHALNQGTSAIFIKELAESEYFLEATEGKIPTKRMQDRDFINRFIAFYLNLSNYKGDLDSFLNECMGMLNKLPRSDLEKIRYDFEQSMKCCFEIFGRYTFRKHYSTDTDDSPRKPISKSLFDTISVNIAWLTDAEREILLSRSDILNKRMIALFDDVDFYDSISVATGQKNKIEIRFYKVKELISEVLQNAY